MYIYIYISYIYIYIYIIQYTFHGTSWLRTETSTDLKVDIICRLSCIITDSAR